jgi:hypothetical protein
MKIALEAKVSMDCSASRRRRRRRRIVLESQDCFQPRSFGNLVTG